jgi:micrococcal nuclease
MRYGLICSVALLAAAPGTAAWTHPPPTLEAIVLHVDDGDTIDVRIDGRVERVRYIGIDAPEVAHEGAGGAQGGEAAARVNRALLRGGNVRLELDQERRDRYGRLLAYVWTGSTMVNLEMVRLGYARALTIPPNVRYTRRFLSAEASAERALLGLWGEGALRPGDPATIRPTFRRRRLAVDAVERALSGGGGPAGFRGSPSEGR